MGWTTPRTWTDGESVTATMLNIHVRDNLLNIGQHQYIPKTSDQSRATNTTLTADSTLLMPVGANETWYWRARIYIITGAGGFQYSWTAPSLSSGDFVTQDVNGTALTLFGDADRDYNTTDSLTASITDTGHYQGILITTVNSGNLTLTWAQNVSNAANTTVKAGSYIIGRRLA